MPETVSAFGALGFLGTPSISSGANTPLSPSNGSARVQSMRSCPPGASSHFSGSPPSRRRHCTTSARGYSITSLPRTTLPWQTASPSSVSTPHLECDSGGGGGTGKESAREGLSVGCITLPLRLRNNTRPTQRTETPWAACLACLTIYCSTPLHTLRRCNTLGWQGWPLTTSGVGCQPAQGAAAQESCQSVMSCSLPPSPVPSSRGSCLGKKQRSLPHARDATRMDDGRQVGLRA